MLLRYFIHTLRSTSKTLLILHVTTQVSPDFYLFRNFWKEKRSQVSPTHTTKLFGKFHLFWLYEYVLQLSCILLNINVYNIVKFGTRTNF